MAVSQCCQASQLSGLCLALMMTLAQAAPAPDPVSVEVLGLASLVGLAGLKGYLIGSRLGNGK